MTAGGCPWCGSLRLRWIGWTPRVRHRHPEARDVRQCMDCLDIWHYTSTGRVMHDAWYVTFPRWAVDYSLRGEDGHFEWLCEHGVGHGGVHTCDGCCGEGTSKTAAMEALCQPTSNPRSR